MSSHWSRRRIIGCAAAAAVVLAGAACAADRIASPSKSLRDGGEIALRGTATLYVATGRGVETRHTTSWAANGRVVNGVARSEARVPETQFRTIGVDAELDRSGSLAAASLVPVLAVRADARRGQPGQTLARDFVHEGERYSLALLYGETGLPETTVLFRNDEPLTMTRYTYHATSAGWQSAGGAVYHFADGKPVAALVAQVDGAEAVQASLGGEAALAAVALVQQVRQAAIWKRMADAMVPPLHAQKGFKCWEELQLYAMHSAILTVAFAAVALACGSMTPACLGAIAAYYAALVKWTEAYYALMRCGRVLAEGSVDAWDGGAGTTEGGVFFSIPNRGSIESKIRDVCYDLTCSEFTMAT